MNKKRKQPISMFDINGCICGGRVWVHCHGKMKGFLRRFAEMGADVLNPVEPPPIGDVSLEEAFDIVGGSMALEGNIESHDVIMETREALGEKLHAAIEAGADRRFILSPCSGYAGSAEPSENEMENGFFYRRRVGARQGMCAVEIRGV